MLKRMVFLAVTLAATAAFGLSRTAPPRSLYQRWRESGHIVSGTIAASVSTVRGQILTVKVLRNYVGTPADSVGVLCRGCSRPFTVGESLVVYGDVVLEGSECLGELRAAGFASGWETDLDPRIMPFGTHVMVLDRLLSGTPEDLLGLEEPEAHKAASEWARSFPLNRARQILESARSKIIREDEILSLVDAATSVYPDADERVAFLAPLRFTVESPVAGYALYEAFYSSKIGESLLVEGLQSTREPNRVAATTVGVGHDSIRVRAALSAMAETETSQAVIRALAVTYRRLGDYASMERLAVRGGTWSPELKIHNIALAAEAPTSERFGVITDAARSDDRAEQEEAYSSLTRVAEGSSEFAGQAARWLLEQPLAPDPTVRLAQTSALRRLGPSSRRLQLLESIALDSTSGTPAAYSATTAILWECSGAAAEAATRIASNSPFESVRLLASSVLSRWAELGGRKCP